MRYEFKAIPPKMKISTGWKNIGDTDLGHIDLDDFRL